MNPGGACRNVSMMKLRRVKRDALPLRKPLGSPSHGRVENPSITFRAHCEPIEVIASSGCVAGVSITSFTSRKQNRSKGIPRETLAINVTGTITSSHVVHGSQPDAQADPRRTAVLIQNREDLTLFDGCPRSRSARQPPSRARLDWSRGTNPVS